MEEFFTLTRSDASAPSQPVLGHQPHQEVPATRDALEFVHALSLASAA